MPSSEPFTFLTSPSSTGSQWAAGSVSQFMGSIALLPKRLCSPCRRLRSDCFPMRAAFISYPDWVESWDYFWHSWAFVSKDPKIFGLELISLAPRESNSAGIERILKHYHDQCPHTKVPFSLQDELETINKLVSGQSVERILKNLEADGSEWSLDILKTLGKMSPTSLKVTMRALETGAELSLQECLQMEYRLSQRCCETNDFIEGVRALLVDKDQNPKWKPPTVDQVTYTSTVSLLRFPKIEN